LSIAATRPPGSATLRNSAGSLDLLTQLRLEALAHALDHVLQHLDFAVDLLRAAQGVFGDGLDHVGEARLDLLDLAGEDQVRLADGGDLIGEFALLAQARDHAVHREAEAEHADQGRGARTRAAANPPDEDRRDQGDADIGARQERQGELAHAASAANRYSAKYRASRRCESNG